MLSKVNRLKGKPSRPRRGAAGLRRLQHFKLRTKALYELVLTSVEMHSSSLKCAVMRLMKGGLVKILEGMKKRPLVDASEPWKLRTQELILDGRSIMTKHCVVQITLKKQTSPPPKSL